MFPLRYASSVNLPAQRMSSPCTVGAWPDLGTNFFQRRGCSSHHLMSLILFSGEMLPRPTFSRRLVIQPILFQVQSILIQEISVSWTELVVQHEIVPFMTSKPSHQRLQGQRPDFSGSSIVIPSRAASTFIFDFAFATIRRACFTKPSIFLSSWSGSW